MTIHVLDARRDAELRALDAAAEVSANPARREATLESILASTGQPNVARVPDGRTGPARRRTRRLVTLGGRAAALAGALVLPALNAAPSYASWTARPSAVTADETGLAREACLDQVGDTVGQLRTADLPVRTSERRGDFVSLMLAGTTVDRLSAQVFCLVELPSGHREVSHVESGSTGGGGLPAPRGRQFTQGAVATLGDGAVSMTEGEVGADVTGLTLHAGGTTVEATVENGAYAAWWPGRAVQPSGGRSGRSGQALDIVYDVTYADGTLARGVAPTASSELGAPVAGRG